MDYGANKISEPVLLGGTHKGERMLESGPFTTVEEWVKVKSWSPIASGLTVLWLSIPLNSLIEPAYQIKSNRSQKLISTQPTCVVIGLIYFTIRDFINKNKMKKVRFFCLT